MLIREYLKSLTFRRKSNVRSRLKRPFDLSEQLELRTLLTGNVQVSLDGANVQLTGDTDANEVEIVVDNGSVVVRGLNGTTINLGTTAFRLATGTTTLAGTLTASLGAGDDKVTIGSGITFTGNVSLSGDGGANILRVLGGTLNGNLTMTGGDGASSIAVDGATISGSLSVRGVGSTLASISNSTIHGHMNVWTGGGADSVVVQSTTVDHSVVISTDGGDDNVALQNSTVHGLLLIDTGSGNDVVYVNSSRAGILTGIATRRGNDTVQVLGSSSFSGLLVIAGGTGHDGVSVASDTSALFVAKFSQRARYFDISQISSRITDSTSGAIARANSLLTTAVPAPTLTLSTTLTSISEAAGTSAATLTVNRTGSTTAALDVTLTSSNTSKITVPSTVTIPAGASSATATIAAVDNNVADGSFAVTVTAAASGLESGTQTLPVTDNEVAALTLTANKSTVTEGDGSSAVTYTVSRNTANISQPLTVSLLSDTPTRLTVNNTATIPANESSVTFVGAAIDNSLVDGDASVNVTASASGFTNGMSSVSVTDNDNVAGTLTVTPDATSIAENSVPGTIFFTVTRTAVDTSQALTVNLASGNTGRVVLPATVTIPAGASSAAIEVTPVNNAIVDGNVDVQLTASATNFATGTWTVTIVDDDIATPIPTLTESLSVSAVAESAGSGSSILTVTRSNSDITQDLLVRLTYSAPARLSGPATITILAGATSAVVSLSPINNIAVDGDIEVDITASATGFLTAQEFLTILDDEFSQLTLTTASTTVSETSGTLQGTVSTSTLSSSPIFVSLLYENKSVLTGPASVIIPAGAASVPVTFTIVNGSIQDQSIVARIAAGAAGASTSVAQVTVTDADTLGLTATATAANSVQSNGTIITRSNVAQVSGVTTAGAIVTIDSNGDGVFDDGTTTAGIDGTYSVDVSLSHTATNNGKNRLVVKAVSGQNSGDTAVSVHMAIGTVVHFTTSLGSYDIELLDTEAPLTVANFLSYVNSNAYQNTFVHRTNSGTARFVQGGGFKVSNSRITTVTPLASVINEFNPANPNVAGTFSMALGATIDSGTSQWFLNTTNNSAGFDPGKYTVFGRVIGNGLAVASQISNLDRYDLNTLYAPGIAFGTVPLISFNAPNTTLTGLVSTAANSAVITGTGTLFTSELAVGDSILIGSGKAYFVASIESDTSLTLTTPVLLGPENEKSLLKDVLPTDAEFVVFSNIGKILDTI